MKTTQIFVAAVLTFATASFAGRCGERGGCIDQGPGGQTILDCTSGSCDGKSGQACSIVGTTAVNCPR
nr:uncharacterized protein CTRU02_15099 [Colletotrichum truncatum]KAF6781459.1 hypothetical protein CTRU02_15099 [Colletotrichum truncatum]